MKKQNHCPFQEATIEIIEITDDIITTSRDPFEGEEDNFDYYWNN